MANMKYCMFENTGNDLGDCIDELIEMTPDEFSELSDSEKTAARDMRNQCQEMIQLLEDIDIIEL